MTHDTDSAREAPKLTKLNPKAFAVARKHLERMMHGKGWHGAKLTISAPMFGGLNVNSGTIAAEIIRAYLDALPPKKGLFDDPLSEAQSAFLDAGRAALAREGGK